MVDEAANPCPDMVTGVSIGPFPGLTLVDGVTVKVASAILDWASIAFTTWLPAVEGGTVKDAENTPFESEVSEGGEVAIVLESYLKVIIELGANPAPVTVMEVPTGSLYELNVTLKTRGKIANSGNDCA